MSVSTLRNDHYFLLRFTIQTHKLQLHAAYAMMKSSIKCSFFVVNGAIDPVALNWCHQFNKFLSTFRRISINVWHILKSSSLCSQFSNARMSLLSHFVDNLLVLQLNIDRNMFHEFDFTHCLHQFEEKRTQKRCSGSWTT